MTSKTPTAREPSAGNLFRPSKPDGRVLTSDQIANHLDAFRAAGGTVEVLGTTRVLKHLGNGDAVAAPPAPAPAKRKR